MIPVYNLTLLDNNNNILGIVDCIVCREILLYNIKNKLKEIAIKFGTDKKCETIKIELESDDPDNIHKVFSKINGVLIDNNTISYKTDNILHLNKPLMSLLLFMTRYGINLEESSISKIVNLNFEDLCNYYECEYTCESCYYTNPYRFDKNDLKYIAFGLYLYLNENKYILDKEYQDQDSCDGIITFLANNSKLFYNDAKNFCNKYGVKLL
jgi:hypothetical protein